MKIKFIKIKTTLAIILSCVLIGSPVLAIGPSVSGSMSKAEKRYGFDRNTLRRAKQKEYAPTADIYFSATNPEEGETVTANAFGVRFKNSAEDLYFTWYLLRETDKEADGDYKKNAIEIAKRRAMGMIARGSFDPGLFEVDYSQIKDPILYPDYEDDDDGYKAPIGGADGVGAKEPPYNDDEGIGTYEDKNYSDRARAIVDGNKITRCYRHNFGDKEGGDGYGALNSGKDLVVSCEHKFASPEDGAPIYDWSGDSDNPSGTDECKDDFEVGDGDFGLEEEACWQLNPLAPDTDGDGVRDEADLAGLGQDQFSWTYMAGDRVGVIIEGTSLQAINEGSSEVTINSLAKDPFNWVVGDNKYLGNGWIRQEVLTDSNGLINYFQSTTNPIVDEVADIIDGKPDATLIPGKGGLVTQEELVEWLDNGGDLETARLRLNCVTNFNPSTGLPLDPDEVLACYDEFPELLFGGLGMQNISDAIELVGLVDLQYITDEIEEYFEIDSGELASVINSILGPLGLTTTVDPTVAYTQINTAYDNGNLTQLWIDSLFSDLPPATITVADIEPYLDGTFLDNSALQNIFDDAITTDSNGVPVTEETFIEAILDFFMMNADSTGYYKIMWGGLEICGSRDTDLVKEDECTKESDLEDEVDNAGSDDLLNFDIENETEQGFTFLATKPVYEEGITVLETEIASLPERPMFVKYNEGEEDDELNYSDEITLTASFKEEGADERFTYYEWIINKCDDADFENCNGPNLASSCNEGEALGSCASTYFNSTSPVKGMGVSQIKFKPEKALMERSGSLVNGKAYFKVSLKTRKSKNATGMSLSSTPLSINMNDLWIDLSRVEYDASSGFYTEEICKDGNYRVICPVYPYQVLKATANFLGNVECNDQEDNDGCMVKGYYWEINGKKIEPLQSSTGLSSPDYNEIYIPILNDFSGLQDISLTVQKEEDFSSGTTTSETTTTRKVSVRDLVTLIEPAAGDTNIYRKVEDDGELSESLYTKPSSTNIVILGADVIPNYLDFTDDNITFDWKLGEQEIDPDFIAENPDLAISINPEGNEMTFTIDNDFGGLTDFKETIVGVNLKKEISEEYSEMLKESWGISLGDEDVFLEGSSFVSIKKDTFTGASTDSMEFFFASTIKNVPTYLIFSLKLGVILVLIWSGLFGSSIFIENYQKEYHEK